MFLWIELFTTCSSWWWHITNIELLWNYCIYEKFLFIFCLSVILLCISLKLKALRYFVYYYFFPLFFGFYQRIIIRILVRSYISSLWQLVKNRLKCSHDVTHSIVSFCAWYMYLTSYWLCCYFTLRITIIYFETISVDIIIIKVPFMWNIFQSYIRFGKFFLFLFLLFLSFKLSNEFHVRYEFKFLLKYSIKLKLLLFD